MKIQRIFRNGQAFLAHQTVKPADVMLLHRQAYILACQAAKQPRALEEVRPADGAGADSLLFRRADYVACAVIAYETVARFVRRAALAAQKKNGFSNSVRSGLGVLPLSAKREPAPAIGMSRCTFSCP